MNPNFKLNLLTLSLLAMTSIAHAEDEVSTQELDEIQVKGKHIAKEKKVFTEGQAKSSRERVYQSSENIDTIVRSMPGVFTQQDKGSGVLAVNIRGDSGLGRVNTMVDGVTQTFYSTSADAGRSGSSSQFGTALDPNFIAGVDVTKGSFSGANGINTLSGTANFRTLRVDDVVHGNNTFGLLTKGLTGTNSTKSNFMATGAVQKWFDSGARLGALYGYSHRNVEQNYKVGGGGQRIGNFGEEYLDRKKQEYFERNLLKFDQGQNRWVRDFSKRNAVGKSYWDYPFSKKYNDPEVLQRDYVDDLERGWKENLAPQWDLTPIDPTSLQQRSNSHLVKVEYENDNNKLDLQLRTMNNRIGSRKVENHNYQANYNLNIGDYVDLNVLAAHNLGKQKYPKNSRFSGWGLLDYLETKNTANLLDINNSFSFKLPQKTDLKATVGFNFFKNQYSKNRFPEELSLFYDGPDQDAGLYSFLGRFKGDKGIFPQKSTILQPSGQQKFNTFYFDTSLKKGIYQLNYSANMVNYRYKGEYTDYFNTQEDFKKAFGEDSEIYKQHCTPSCDLYEPVYTKSGKKHAVNHSVALNINVNDYFMPFISYSRTHRMPNIQEMYFSQIGDSGVNTALKPEQANTYQIGFNTFKKGIFKPDDVLGFKLVAYRSRINNYIHNVYGKWWDLDKAPSWVTSTGLQYSIQHRNYAKPVHKNGLEVEMNYDFGRFFTTLSYAYQKTNQPTNYSDASESPRNSSKEDQIKQGYGLSKISRLPRDYGRFELGSRWLGNKLTIGGIMRYYGKSTRATTEEEFVDGTTGANTYSSHQMGRRVIKKTESINRQPMIFDFYANYEPKKNLILRFDIQNAFNKRYVDPLDAANDAATQRYFSVFERKGGLDDEEVECDANGLCNGKYSGTTRSVLNNYARGRTLLFTISYKF